MSNLLQKIMKRGVKDSLRAALNKIAVKISGLVYRIFLLFPVNPNLIAFESEGDLSDNAFALYEYLAKNNYFTKGKYQAVWFVDSLEHSVPYPNTCFVHKAARGFCFRRAYYLATCKYFIYDHCNLLANVKKRKECMIIYLCHGVGFKGKKAAGHEINKADKYFTTGRLFHSWSKLLFNYDESIISDAGYPRNDYLFMPLNDSQRAFASEFAFSSYKKIFLWMPTFRRSWSHRIDESYFDSQTGLPIISDFDSLDVFNNYLADNNALCIFKMHHLQADLFSQVKPGMSYSNFIFLQDSDIQKRNLQLYQIISFADCLITDYSSISVDFYLLDRPVIFTIDDYEEYKASRGLAVYDGSDDVIRFFAGHLCRDKDEFFAALDDVNRGNDRFRDKRHSLLSSMHAHPDGNSCRRIVSELGL